MKKRGASRSKNVSPDALTEVTFTQGDLKTVSTRDEKSLIKIDPFQITKIFNPRFVPVPLELIGGARWPDIEEDHPDLREKHEAILRNEEWFASLPSDEQSTTLDWLGKIHELSASILALGQAQPIVLEREAPESLTAFLVAGERRTLAVAYSQGKIPKLDAVVWNRRLDKLARAKIQDAENNHREELSTVEIIRAKAQIWEALSEPESLTLTELASHWGYSSASSASPLRSLFMMPNYEDLYSSIAEQGIGVRDLYAWLRTNATRNLETDSDSGEASVPLSRPGRKPKNEVFRSAERFGLRVAKSTDIGVPAMLIKQAVKAKGFPQWAKDEIEKFDIDSKEGLAAAWVALGEALSGSK